MQNNDSQTINIIVPRRRRKVVNNTDIPKTKSKNKGRNGMISTTFGTKKGRNKTRDEIDLEETNMTQYTNGNNARLTLPSLLDSDTNYDTMNKNVSSANVSQMSEKSGLSNNHAIQKNQKNEKNDKCKNRENIENGKGDIEMESQASQAASVSRKKETKTAKFKRLDREWRKTVRGPLNKDGLLAHLGEYYDQKMQENEQRLFQKKKNKRKKQSNVNNLTNTRSSKLSIEEEFCYYFGVIRIHIESWHVTVDPQTLRSIVATQVEFNQFIFICYLFSICTFVFLSILLYFVVLLFYCFAVCLV